MAVKYSQTLQKEKTGAWKLLVKILLLLFGINLLIGFIADIFAPNIAGYTTLLIFALMVFINWKLLNNHLAEYKYVLTHQSFIVTRVIGKTEKEMLHIPVEEIEYLASKEYLKNHRELQKRSRKNYSFLVNSLKEPKKYRAYFKKNDKLYSFVFQPNKKMLEQFKKEIGDKVTI